MHSLTDRRTTQCLLQLIASEGIRCGVIPKGNPCNCDNNRTLCQSLTGWWGRETREVESGDALDAGCQDVYRVNGSQLWVELIWPVSAAGRGHCPRIACRKQAIVTSYLHSAASCGFSTMDQSWSTAASIPGSAVSSELTDMSKTNSAI